MRSTLLLATLGLCACTASSDPFEEQGSHGDLDGDGTPTHVDCDDQDADVAGPTPFHLDQDGDGYGHPDVTTERCHAATGWVDDSSDCDDADDTVHPGAAERCGGQDDDCDGLIDEADPDFEDVDAELWYLDADGDGWGDEATAAAASCGGEHTASIVGDCDDGDDTVHPGALERCGDGVDNDCDGQGCVLPTQGSVADAHLLLTSTDPADGSGQSLGAADLDGDGAAEVLLGRPWSNAAGFGAGAITLAQISDLAHGAVDTEALGILTREADEAGLGTSAVLLDGAVDGGPLLLVGGTGLVVGLVEPSERVATSQSLTEADVSTFSATDATPVFLSHLGDPAGDGGSVAVALQPGADDGAGVAYLLSSEWLATTTETSLAAAPVSVRGTTSLGALGSGPCGAAAADLDGDGLDEVVLGAPGASSDTEDHGAIVVLPGTSLATDGAHSAGDLDAWTADSSDEGARLGHCLVGLGDLDADGRDDLAVATPGAEQQAGRVHILAGGALSTEGLVELAQLRGATGGEQLGSGLARPAELDDSDGLDLAVGAQGATWSDGAWPGAGVVRVFAVSDLAGTVEASEAAFTIAADSADAGLGRAGALVSGDLNGDGHDDLALGTAGTGEVSIFFSGGL